MNNLIKEAEHLLDLDILYKLIFSLDDSTKSKELISKLLVEYYNSYVKNEISCEFDEKEKYKFIKFTYKELDIVVKYYPETNWMIVDSDILTNDEKNRVVTLFYRIRNLNKIDNK